MLFHHVNDGCASFDNAFPIPFPMLLNCSAVTMLNWSMKVRCSLYVVGSAVMLSCCSRYFIASFLPPSSSTSPSSFASLPR